MDDDFLDAIEDDNEAETTVTTPVEIVVEAKPAEPVQTVQPAAETPLDLTPAMEAKPEPQTAPISALLDERDKRKQAEAELARLREWQQAQQPQEEPDPFEDPQAYRAHERALAANSALNVKLDLSEDLTRTAHGDELVDAAKEWALRKFSENPGFQQQVVGQRNPYGYVVKEYQRDQIASQVSPDDYAQFQAWRAAQTAIEAPSITSRSIPPRSLASAPSAGNIMLDPVQSDEDVFAETFQRK